MKLIIDIPNYNLDEVQNGSIASGQILKAVKNGIPLPKGHGRLVDENYIIAELVYRKHLLSDGVKCGEVTKIFDNAVVIDADMGSSNEADN
jgi:hypothetical protein